MQNHVLITCLFRIDAKSSLGCLPPPVFISYSIPIQNWSKILSLLLCSFLIQFLVKVNAKSSIGCLPPPVVISDSILNQNWCKIFSWLPSSSCGHLLSNSFSKLMQNHVLITCLFKIDAKSSLGCLPPPSVISYSTLLQNWCIITFLIQIWCKMLLCLPRLLPWPFVIQFLSKLHEKCSSGSIASRCGRFLSNSYANLIQNVPLPDLPPRDVALPPLIVVVSHTIFIQSRS